MLAHVGQCLLHDAVDLCLRLRVEAKIAGLIRDVDVQREQGVRGHPLRVGLCRGTQALAGLDRAPQPQDRLAHVHVHGPRRRAQLRDLDARLVHVTSREMPVDRL